MAATQQDTARTASAPVEQYDVIVIGAGISGMYLLHRLRGMGFNVRVYEAGTGVGGTWYWNRYPGARFDSESYSYGYSFSEELLQEWDWSEHFAAQPETLRYLNYVADKFDLKRDIQFEARIASAHYQDADQCWEIETTEGQRARARYLVTAIGVLSAPNMPQIEGIDSFEGPSWHTGQWPHEPQNFHGKRVGVIGSGATAVQMITEVAKDVGHLTVFQRTANYCVPLRNSPIDPATQADIKQRYPEIFARCRETFAAFLHGAVEQAGADATAEERRAFFEDLYQTPGFALWMGNYSDVFTNRDVNEELSEFVREKIRARIKDPVIAERLCPTNHGFGTRRVPLESGYYEVYNQDNVELVDVRESPIERITPKGVKTRDGEYELGILIYATGFDAVTGAFERMDIRGEQGQSLRDKWKQGPQTYLGMQTAGFPNLFTCVGPHNGATFCNIPRCIEQNVEWISDCINYLREHQVERIEATPEAETAWTAHVAEAVEGSLLLEPDSWFVGANVPGKARAFLMYAGGMPNYHARCDSVAETGYEGFKLD